MQGRVALMSYHTQRSCGHEWEGKRGRFPVPASLQLNVYIHIVPPLGAYKSQLGGTYMLSLLFFMVNVCDRFLYFTYVVGPPPANGRGVFVVFCRVVLVFTAFCLFLAVPMVRFSTLFSPFCFFF